MIKHFRTFLEVYWCNTEVQKCTFLYKRMLIQHVKEKINERSKQWTFFISNMIMNGLHVSCFCFWLAQITPCIFAVFWTYSVHFYGLWLMEGLTDQTLIIFKWRGSLVQIKARDYRRVNREKEKIDPCKPIIHFCKRKKIYCMTIKLNVSPIELLEYQMN